FLGWVEPVGDECRNPFAVKHHQASIVAHVDLAFHDEQRALVAYWAAPQIDTSRSNGGRFCPHFDPLVRSLLRLRGDKPNGAAYQVKDQRPATPPFLPQVIGNDQNGVLSDCNPAAIIEGEEDARRWPGAQVVSAGDYLPGLRIIITKSVALDAD